MGLFDFFLSDDSKIQRHQRRLNNRDAQPEDREASARWLADSGSPKALLALLTRFDTALEHQLKDQGEKELVYSLLVGKGSATIEPTVAWLKSCKQVALPLRLYEELTDNSKAIEAAFELLAAERARDDFKPDKKKRLLVWLADQRHPGATTAAAPFLGDFDEGVRYAALEVLAAQDGPDAQEPLLAALLRPDEESNRVRVRIADVFANRRWTVDPARVADRLPSGYAVRDNRIVGA
jgi:HEAT repeat protein